MNQDPKPMPAIPGTARVVDTLKQMAERRPVEQTKQPQPKEKK